MRATPPSWGGDALANFEEVFKDAKSRRQDRGDAGSMPNLIDEVKVLGTKVSDHALQMR